MTQSTPPPAAIRKLPIGETVGAAYATVFTQFGLFLKAAFAPFLITLLLAAIVTYNLQRPGIGQLANFLSLVPYTLFGVAWHRLTLLGGGEGAPAFMPTWRRRHWRFLAYMLAVMLIMMVLMLPYGISLSYLVGAGSLAAEGSPGMALLAVVVVLATIVLIIFMMLRLSFVFPAVSVDETYRLGDSWNHTKGQVWRLFGTLVLALLPLILASWVLGAILGALLIVEIVAQAPAGGLATEQAMEDFLAANAGSLMVINLFVTPFYYLMLAVVVSVFSSAFRSLTGWIPESAAGVPAPYKPGD